jgi:dihydroxyacetone kinase-like predicted kinase
MSLDSTRMDRLRDRPFDGQAMKRLVEAGMTWLKTNQQTVNSLNVFPVPDGDTGTNMMLTMTSAWNEVKNSGEKHAGKMIYGSPKAL